MKIKIAKGELKRLKKERKKIPNNKESEEAQATLNDFAQDMFELRDYERK